VNSFIKWTHRSNLHVIYEVEMWLQVKTRVCAYFTSLIDSIVEVDCQVEDYLEYYSIAQIYPNQNICVIRISPIRIYAYA